MHSDAFNTEKVQADAFFYELRKKHPERVSDLRLTELLWEACLRAYYEVWDDGKETSSNQGGGHQSETYGSGS